MGYERFAFFGCDFCDFLFSYLKKLSCVLLYNILNNTGYNVVRITYVLHFVAKPVKPR